MQMYVQGVSTRRVKTITEELCGHEFSASAISELNVKMDEELKRFMHRRLDEANPYIILDARYERVREASCLRLVQALAVETYEEWVDENRYLNMDLLRDQYKHPAPQTRAV
jgi:transposase-like protein